MLQPCETLMSAKQAINGKLQDSIATYLTCGGVVNNQISKDLLLSPSVNFLTGKYLAQLQATSKNVIVSSSRSVLAWRASRKVHETTTFLLKTLHNIHQF